MKRFHRLGLILLGMALAFALLIVGELVYFFSDAIEPYDTASAKAALDDTELSACHAAASGSLHFNSHGGFHGDGCTLTIFEVDHTGRELIWAALQSAPGWTTTATAQADWAESFPSCSCHPDVYPTADVVFDARYDRVDHTFSDGWAMNYTRAFYDQETGLFFYFRIDT